MLQDGPIKTEMERLTLSGKYHTNLWTTTRWKHWASGESKRQYGNHMLTQNNLLFTGRIMFLWDRKGSWDLHVQIIGYLTQGVKEQLGNQQGQRKLSIYGSRPSN